MFTHSPQSFEIPYGSSSVPLQLTPDLYADVILPPESPPLPDPLHQVEQALEHPLNGFSYQSLGAGQSVAIAVNDKTRPVPHHLLLPPLLARLEALGYPPQQIKLIIATGTHTPATRQEIEASLPSGVLERYPVLSHNCDDLEQLVYLGVTSRQTPIWVNRSFYEADQRIVVGNIEPHHFMGFSGGVKSAAIGLAGRETINPNHAMLIDPLARMGEFDHNPMRQDIEEIGQRIGVHLALNTVMNRHKQIVKVFAGRPLDVMRAGMDASRQVCQIPVSHVYDLAIASPGGHPKDINLYQAQKAITHAAHIVRDGGVVLLAAACPEGSGSAAFEAFVEDVSGYEEVFRKFKQLGFRVGPHKAFQIAREAARIHLMLLSEIPPQLVQKFLLQPVPTLQEGFHEALSLFAEQPRIALMPYATNTIPIIQGD
ncbi:MAG: nickel-dependent lactate racemase [Anaerolineaceae bacterium]|nr:nickel-dependent lactate racemase [Anaerolineaceae bacterium]